MGKSRSAVLSLVLLVATICSSCATREKILLQYHPKVGEKRTMRVSYDLATTHPSPLGRECTEHIRTFTLEVEPICVGADGSVVTRIGIRQIYLKSFRHSDGRVFMNFDSTRDPNEYNASGEAYLVPLGESFTVVTSAQGKILKWNVDALLEPRGMETLQLLVNSLLVPFAPEPVPTGNDWKAPVLVSIEALMEMAGTYRLKTVDNNVCTIQVKARRTPRDKTMVEQKDPTRKQSKIGGRYKATLRVDRTTGCLLARQDLMNLSGGLFMPIHSAAKPDGTVPVTTKATTTVEEVK